MQEQAATWQDILQMLADLARQTQDIASRLDAMGFTAQAEHTQLLQAAHGFASSSMGFTPAQAEHLTPPQPQPERTTP